ncbi:MAG TPA: COR domain-containing protein [Anaerolineales bacterium]|nr:COR domain-containing protein [Anaerolineales bacterium]HLO28298.1 COR domain-containing protein [Anaerolineales bacterium]
MDSEEGYKIALSEIEKAAITGVRELNLSMLKLAQLPAEIGQLVNLASLNLSDNELETLPAEVGQLVNLTSLNLSNNALQRLPAAIGQLVNLTSLNLSNNQLDLLSKEIGQLANLTSLDLSSNRLSLLPEEIGQLVNLTSIFIANNHLKSLPVEIGRLVNLNLFGLSNNTLFSLPEEIGQLVNLTALYLSSNQLKLLPRGIGKLVNLKSLLLANNHLESLPVEIGKLVNLTILALSNNQLNSLPPEIDQLVNLTTLELVDNELSELPAEIGELSQLKRLFLDNNNLLVLPNEIGKLKDLRTLTLRPRDRSGENQQKKRTNSLASLPDGFKNLKDLEMLNLKGNSLPIPPEILAKTNQPLAILDYYFSRLKKALNECKVLVVGQGSVGKTSLIQRLIMKKYNPDESKTEGIVITQWQIQSETDDDSSKINLNIWDFGGQEIMHATHQFFLTKRSLYMLVLDARLTQEENRVEYWLKVIQSYGSNSPVLIIGNKIDQHPLDIDRIGLQRKYSNIVGILETSAALGIGIEELKTAITIQVNILPHVRDLLPETWFTVKTKLEVVGHESNFITHDDYDKLCSQNSVHDETSQHTLISFLHDLGVVLYFQDDPRLESLGILNPQWVTNGVYKILNSHTLFQNKGILTVSLLDEILNLPEYPRGKRLFIVDMMKKFELCYDIEVDKTFLVPDLLPKDEPAELKFTGIAAFEYAYPVLPSSIITRFIVRMNQHIHDGLVWRTGVLLKIGNNRALVKADSEDRKITIAIEGLEHTRRDALAAIRYQLDEIHNSIKGLDAQKRVPIPNAPNAEPLEYEYLLMLEREGQEAHLVKDGTRLVKINVREVLSGIERESQRRETGGSVTNIYVGGNFDGNLTVGDDNQSIKDSYNRIASAKIDTNLKETLKQLTDAVAVMAKALPAEQAAEATDDLAKLVEEATKPAPNKKWYSVSIEGLIKAAENVDKVGGPVINLSRQVLSILTGGIVS